MSNAYFQIGCSPSGTILKLVKQTDGGLPVDAKEIADYLNSKKVIFSLPAIGKAVNELDNSDKKEQLVLLNKDMGPEINESYVLRSSSDKMTLTARFYAPSLKGNKISADEFINDLVCKGVKNGIDEEAIKAFFAKREYCADIVVATGTPVKQGKHARIEYYFETDLNQKPALNEDGSVDFRNLKTFVQCSKGDIVAKLFPEERGEAGMTIFGEPIPPAEVKRKTIKHGRNLILSEDGRTLTADVSGHITLVEDKVFLSDVMEVDNVGPATGNIEYDGSIKVLGNVLENFSVKAKGTVEVKGVVEGAYIESEEDIIIARGMKGMGKGKLKAGRNIIAKFIENSEVTAGGYVETESILHSTVMAGTDVVVSSHKGFITGGRVSAANLIRVKTLGSDMGADTIVEVGADPEMKKRMQELAKLIQEANKSIAQATPVLANFLKKIKGGGQLSLDQKMYMQSLMDETAEKKENLSLWIEEHDALQVILENTTDSCVEVTGDVYAGTRIFISDVSMVVKDTLSYCRFKKIDGDVKMRSL